MNFYQLIMSRARTSRDRPAIAFAGGVATYAMLAEGAVAAARKLDALKLSRSGLVAVDVRNPLHHVMLSLALGLRGIPSASVQFNFNIADSGIPIAALVADQYSKGGGAIRTVLVEDDWFVGAPDWVREKAAALADEDLVRVAFSSGTTGQPKPIALTNRLLDRRLMEAVFAIDLPGTMRLLNMIGMSTLGSYIACVYVLTTGGMLCYASNSQEALQVIRLFGVTELAVAPVQLQALVDLQKKSFEPLPSLRLLGVAGGWTSDALIADATTLMCGRLVISYTSTELGVITTVAAQAVRGLDSAVGYALPWVEIEIVDPAGGPVAPGTIGEVRAKSHALAPYLVDTEDTRRLYRDGWYHPGDAGYMREDGLLFITGRTVDLMNRGGVTLAPDAVEAAFKAQFPVVDIGVFGHRVPGGTEEVWAAVVPVPGFNAAAALEASRRAMTGKHPDRIVEVAIIPRNDMGKVMRAKLKEVVLAELARLEHDPLKPDHARRLIP
ncbi:MAG: long-chain fatty acid--CoA ligase [Bauldia sp.]|nr:long-chain fatty acid--CoA ligase [Bauldia sp.]